MVPTIIYGLEYPYTTDRTCQRIFINTTSEYSGYYKEINQVLEYHFQNGKIVNPINFKFLNESMEQNKLYLELIDNYYLVRGTLGYMVNYATPRHVIVDYYCPSNKNIRYPLEKKSWIYQYQVLIDDILKKNEDTRTRIQENEFNVLDDQVLANHITNYLKNNGYIRVIKGDMYPVYPGKNVPTQFNLQVVENKNNTNTTTTTTICDDFAGITFCYYPVLTWAILIISGFTFLISFCGKDNEKKNN